jgi:hypothetical protein
MVRKISLTCKTLYYHIQTTGRHTEHGNEREDIDTVNMTSCIFKAWLIHGPKSLQTHFTYFTKSFSIYMWRKSVLTHEENIQLRPSYSVFFYRSVHTFHSSASATCLMEPSLFWCKALSLALGSNSSIPPGYFTIWTLDGRQFIWNMWVICINASR